MYLHWLISFPNGRHGSIAAHRNWACGLAVGGWEDSRELGTDPEERLEREVPFDKVYSG